MKKIILLLMLISLTVSAADELEYPLGHREPTAEEQAYIDEHVTQVEQIMPNELAVARSLAEIMSFGENTPQSLSIPTSVDNSTLKYFPPIFTQGGLNSCAAFHTVYYYASYRQAQDRDLDIRDGNRANVMSPAFIYNLMNGNANRATPVPLSIMKLCEIGAPSWNTMPYDGADYWTWPSTTAWIEALNNRMQTTYAIDASTTAGINAVRQHLANGNIANSYFTVRDTFWSYPNDTNGINNQVLYWQVPGFVGGHGSTLVGYDDNRSYIDHRDGQTKYGAFLCANSWGQSWGIFNTTGTWPKGYYWVAYNMFMESEFGPLVYFNSDRLDYRPRLYALAGINHSQRFMLTHGGGVGPTGSPLFTGPDALKYVADSNNAAIADTQRVAVDLTDSLPVLQTGTTNTLFVKTNNSSLSSVNASVTSVDFYYDLDGTGAYGTISSTRPPIFVKPNFTEYFTADLALAGSKNIYVDDSNISGPWDGTSDHPYLTIQAGIDAATFGDTVLVRDGTYTGAGNKEIDPKSKYINIKSENGSATTVIDCQGAGRGFYIHTQETAQTVIDGFTVTGGNDTSGNGGGGIFIWESSPVIKNCFISGNVTTANGGGICSRKLSEPIIFNCLILGNSAVEGGGIMSSNGKITIQNCTITGNNASTRGGGLYFNWGNTGTITDSIMWLDVSPEGAEIALSSDTNPSTLTVSNCDIEGGQAGASVMSGCTLIWGTGNINSDPLFAAGVEGVYYLSQITAGQAVTSPCVDAGSGTSLSLGLSGKTTATNKLLDTGAADIGYHYNAGLYVCEIERSSSNVTIRWNAQGGVSYIVQWSEDMQTWNDVPVGAVSEWTDTDTEGYGCKTYRVIE